MRPNILIDCLSGKFLIFVSRVSHKSCYVLFTMNPNSTGHEPIEDDIEMIDIHEPRKFHPNEYRPIAANDDLDDDENPDDDGNIGLLSGRLQTTHLGVSSPASAWAQVRSIVIEVRGRSNC